MRWVSVREGSQAMSSNVQGVSLRTGCVGGALVVMTVEGIVRRVVVDVAGARAVSVIGGTVDDTTAELSPAAPGMALPLPPPSTFPLPLPLFHPPFAFIPAFATFTATPAATSPSTPTSLPPSPSLFRCTSSPTHGISNASLPT